MVKIMPKRSKRDPRLVAALLYDGLGTFEFAIAAEVFGLPRPEMGPEWYRFVTCAETAEPLRANGHVRISVESDLTVLDEAGTIVIPGWRTDGPPASESLAEALHQAHSSGARLVTICSGAFLLAELGMLDGRKVTTHWRYAERLKQRHPNVEVLPDVLYVDGGDILTSAGSAAGVDLLLHVVRKDFGAEAANRVARRLVMPPHRDGGQAQFVERPVSARPNRLSPLLDRIRAAPAEPWTIAQMAGECHMSERTFIRRFNEAVGSSPGEWLLATRVDAARELLEAGEANLDDVAAASGFGSVATLRHHFRKRLGVSPAAYRRRFTIDPRLSETFVFT